MTGTKKGDLPEMADKEKETEKPLEKMTAIELRELAKAIPGITGVHGMKKAELLAAVKEARGIKEEVTPKADKTVGGIKKKIKTLKAARQAALEAKDKKMAKIYRRRISRLKKQTRKAA
jgi:DNA-binding ferritin-like protein